MNVTDTATRTPATEPAGARRAPWLAAGAVALLALTACTSNPGPSRVARDIVEAEAAIDPDLDEECLLTELERFSDDDLSAIADDLAASDEARNADGERALAAFQLSLESCR